MSLTDAMLLDPYPFHRWISNCTDSAGTGTVNDPFRADTAAKFDELDWNGPRSIRFRTTNFPAFFNNKKADGTLVRGYEGLVAADPVQKVIPELADTISEGATFGCL